MSTTHPCPEKKIPRAEVLVRPSTTWHVGTPCPDVTASTGLDASIPLWQQTMAAHSSIAPPGLGQVFMGKEGKGQEQLTLSNI